MPDSFAHLHVHTEYSMLDGAARVNEVVEAAAEDGQPAIGITDHGNMYGVVPFYKACEKAGITPVIGSELYMAYEHRAERLKLKGSAADDNGGADGHRKGYYHLTVLAENNTGYRNLIQLSSRAFLEGYYRKPKVDWDLLADHSEGVIATTGCLGGHVLQELVREDRGEEENFAAALAKAGRLQDIFGRENLFVELQDHGMPEQVRTNPMLVRLARKLDAPLLATNDCHYVNCGDATAHDALLCVQTGALMSDEKRFRFHGHDHYLKSAAEMRGLFSGFDGACDNTLLIAERADVQLDFGSTHLPVFPLPDGFTSDADYLQHLTFEGARERWGQNLPDSVTERLLYELKVISDMGFASYFLIVWDLIAHAHRSGIRVGPGRGSAAGCAVAYSLRITDLDPIKYDLLFERFLNPSRVSMPDIDMDFDSRFRDEMIRYAAEKYGRDHVAQIVTFSTIKARAAVQDAARVLGFDFQTGLKISKAMPPLISGRDTSLAACFEKTEGFEAGFQHAAGLRSMYESDPDVKQIVDVARGLEGLRRQDGVHAAAVVITPEPVTEFMPVQRKVAPWDEGVDAAPIVTQYEMGAVEDLGLLKMDFLALRNLDVISDTLQLLADQGVVLDIGSIPLDDPETVGLLGRGDAIGVFQLEGAQMRQLVRLLAPTSFEDVSALVALYRPGPMSTNMHIDYADRKNGRKPVEHYHPDLAEVLGDTFGLMIYQESLMRVAQRMAGFSLADADTLRKACGKKKRDLIEEQREKFVAGCVAQGHPESVGTRLFDIIVPFADYAFCKAHAYGYGLIAYQTAYLKAHHPVEYMAALLTSVKSNQEKAAVYLNECRTMGIEVRVPDVNRSLADFAPDGDGSVLFGLSAVRNVGDGVVKSITDERESGGPFVDFYDFCERVPVGVLNKKTMEALVKAGAFDSFGVSRRGLLTALEPITEYMVDRRKEADAGVMSLFDAPDSSFSAFDDRPSIPSGADTPDSVLRWEKEMLGVYVSGHPLIGLEDTVERLADCAVADLGDVPDDEMRNVVGVVSGVVRKTTRKGDPMVQFQLDDVGGSVKVVAFPEKMRWDGVLSDEDVVCVRGRVNSRDGQVELVASKVDPVASSVEPLRVLLSAELDDVALGRLRRVFERHPGQADVLLVSEAGTVRLPAQWRVGVSERLVGELRVMLGAGAVSIPSAV